MLADFQGEPVSVEQAVELAMSRSTTFARCEIGEWVIHVDWHGQPGYPFSVYVWRGEEWVETSWAANATEAMSRYARTACLVAVGHWRRSTAAAAALPQHHTGQQGMEPVGSMLGANLPTWALFG